MFNDARGTAARESSRALWQLLCDHFQWMKCSPSSQIMNLVPARGSRSNDKCIGLRRQSRQEVQLCDRHAEIVMLALEAERTRHAAAAGVENGHVQAGHLAQGVRRASHAAERLLMAVP